MLLQDFFFLLRSELDIVEPVLFLQLVEVFTFEFRGDHGATELEQGRDVHEVGCVEQANQIVLVEPRDKLELLRVIDEFACNLRLQRVDQVRLRLPEVEKLSVLNDEGQVLAADAGQRDRLTKVIFIDILAQVLHQDAHLCERRVHLKSFTLGTDQN